MTSSRLLPLLGPVLVLYLAVQAAAAGQLGLDARLLVMLALAMCTPALLLRRRDDIGVRRVASLGSLAALAFTARLGGETLFGELLFAVATCAAAALLVDLALRVPDAPPAIARLQSVVMLGAVVTGALGAAASLPVFSLFGETILAPPSFLAFPPAFGLAALGLALLLRAARRRLGSAPEALASNVWALTGTVPAFLVGLLALFRALRTGADLRDPRELLPLAVATLLLLYGHAALVDVERRPTAGKATRAAAATLITLGLVAAAAPPGQPRLPADAPSFARAATLFVGVAFVLRRGLALATHRVLAPHGGRLVDAIVIARASIGGALGLEDLAAGLLGPLRAAGGEATSHAWLYTLAPPRETRVDLAGQAITRSGELPEPVVSALLAAPGDVIVTPDLAARVVREPKLRALVEILERWEAVAVVPLRAGDELEGCFVLPRGRRRTSLGLEEVLALARLGREAGAKVALITARERAQQRVGELARVRDRQAEALEAADETTRRLRAESEALRQGRAASRLSASPVAYAPAMRALEDALAELASEAAALTLVAEAGLPVDVLARRVHARSGRAEGPFVVADCAAVLGGEPAAALFGGGARRLPGWLRLAEGGTLVLADVPALPVEAQRALAEALAVRTARAVGEAGSYPVDVRVIATSRRPLREAGLDAELARWVGARVFVVPPLRERSEDLPSLALRAVDRACRVLGRPTLGIGEDAMAALLAHDWPGNLRELQHVLERATARAAGPVLRRGDLPILGAPLRRAADPLAGSWAEVERRVLERALERAEGNKSEAARALGLKRTTFLDKLRRSGVEDQPRPN
ncbi:MAG: sigma 54-interacting transcriptional regulator [Myxococcota bacterium]